MRPVIERIQRAAAECARSGQLDGFKRMDDELELMARAAFYRGEYDETAARCRRLASALVRAGIDGSKDLGAMHLGDRAALAAWAATEFARFPVEAQAMVS